MHILCDLLFSMLFLGKDFVYKKKIVEKVLASFWLDYDLVKYRN